MATLLKETLISNGHFFIKVAKDMPGIVTSLAITSALFSSELILVFLVVSMSQDAPAIPSVGLQEPSITLTVTLNLVRVSLQAASQVILMLTVA